MEGWKDERMGTITIYLLSSISVDITSATV